MSVIRPEPGRETMSRRHKFTHLLHSLILLILAASTFLLLKTEPLSAGGCPPAIETCIDQPYFWREGGMCVSGGCFTGFQICCL